MFQGLKPVLLIFILTLFISILFRLIIALLRCTTTKLIGYVLEAYILFMRGTPLLLQLIVILVCYLF